jgi:AraC family transcriptional regulator
MSDASDGFTIHETHGILLQPGFEIGASSDQRGWSSLYASVQREAPYEGAFSAVDDQLLVLHLDGPATVHMRFPSGEDSRLVPPGGVTMTPGGMNVRVRLGEPLHTLHLYLRRALLEEVTETMLAGDPSRIETLPRLGDSDPLIESLLLGVREALHDENPSAIPYVDYLARAIAARLIQRHSSASSVRRSRDTPARLTGGPLSKAIDFMQANLERSIDLPAIAGATGLSPSHFARQFRVTVGKAPHQYLMQLRIERAKRLMRETAISVAEVAFACGFANQEHMTRLFKQHCGTTPAAYRKALRT